MQIKEVNQQFFLHLDFLFFYSLRLIFLILMNYLPQNRYEIQDLNNINNLSTDR